MTIDDKFINSLHKSSLQVDKQVGLRLPITVVCHLLSIEMKELVNI